MPLGWGVDIAVSYTQGSRLPNPDKRMPMRNKGGELVGGWKPQGTLQIDMKMVKILSPTRG